ncbi:MAG: ATP-binding protein [Thermodesulfobacteriota bacterium]
MEKTALVARTFPNDLSQLAGLTELVSEAADIMDVHQRCLFELTLAVEEIFTNIVKYAFDDKAPHTIRVSMEKVGERVLVTRFEDDGKPFDPTRAAEPDLNLPVELRPVGKLGIFLVKKIMDSMTYERVEGKNVITLTKTMRPDACVLG